MTVGLIAVGAPAHAATVQVTWPEITDFNPDITDYTINISYNGSGFLFLVGYDNHDWQGSVGFRESLPRNGSHEVGFAWPIGSPDYRLVVLLCPDDDPYSDECRLVATSPSLTLYNYLKVRLSYGPSYDPLKLGPDQPIIIRSIEPASVGPVDVTWAAYRTVNSDGEPIATREAEEIPAGGRFWLTDPFHHLPTGTPLRLEVSISGATTRYGNLTSFNGPAAFEWDDANEGSLSLSSFYGANEHVGVDTFYPVEDQEGDDLWIGLEGERKPRWVSWEIRGPRGALVYSFADSSPLDGPSISWYGKNRAGHLLPEGRYTVSIDSLDAAGNAGHVSRVVYLSHARLEARHVRQTFTPEDLVDRERTGACGRVQRPASPEWPGSIGLYTDDRCVGGGGRFAQVIDRVELPYAPVITRATVTVAGFKARGETSSDLQVRVRTDNDGEQPRWGDWTTIPSDVTRHQFTVPVVRSGTRGARLLWVAAAQHGDRYDLRSFTVEYGYLAPID